MTARIRTGDTARIISGDHRGTTGKVLQVMPGKNAALIEGVGTRTRKVKPSQLNPTGGTRDLHTPVSLHKLALVTDTKSMSTSRVGYTTNTSGAKVRVARQNNNKEIK